MKRRWRARRGMTLLEVGVSVLLLGFCTVLFVGLYPMSARSSRMSGNQAQAISIVQHKVDQLRALGYGRLTFADMRAAGVIDPTPTAAPYRFEATDNIASVFPSPVGTISVASAGTDLARVTVRLQWVGAPGKVMEGYHEVQVLIANE